MVSVLGDDGGEGDLVAEGLQSPSETFGFTAWVGELVPPADAKVDVVAALGVQVPQGDDDGVSDRDEGALFLPIRRASRQ